MARAGPALNHLQRDAEKAGLPVSDQTARLRRIEDIRKRRQALIDNLKKVDEELEEGLRSLAVPIRNASGTVLAALNVSVHASRTSMVALRRDFLPAALRAATAIEADLHGGSTRRADVAVGASAP